MTRRSLVSLLLLQFYAHISFCFTFLRINRLDAAFSSQDDTKLRDRFKDLVQELILSCSGGESGPKLFLRFLKKGSAELPRGQISARNARRE